MASVHTRKLPAWRPAQLTPWQTFRRDPATFLARWLYARRTAWALLPPSTVLSTEPVTVVCVSDTHCTTPDVPDGDILLHAGDLSARGTFAELQAQLDWLKTLPHRHKVVIAGNHDLLLDSDFTDRFPDCMPDDSGGEGTSRDDLDWGDIVYLNNASTKMALEGGRTLTVYGSPWTEQFGNWAFQYPPVRRVWPESIPDGTDIVLTHGPPKGHLDMAGKGCPQLLREVRRVKPQLVVFGHIHDGHGREDLVYDGLESAYDGIMAGDWGLLAVLAMAWCLVWSRLRAAAFPRRPTAGTRLVNAAVLAGRAGEKEQKSHEVIVVEL